MIRLRRVLLTLYTLVVVLPLLPLVLVELFGEILLSFFWKRSAPPPLMRGLIVTAGWIDTGHWITEDEETPDV